MLSFQKLNFWVKKDKVSMVTSVSSAKSRCRMTLTSVASFLRRLQVRARVTMLVMEGRKEMMCTRTSSGSRRIGLPLFRRDILML